MPIKAKDGEVVAYAVDALAASSGGQINYLIIRVGGVGGLGETLHRLPWHAARIADGEVKTDLDKKAIQRLPVAVAS